MLFISPILYGNITTDFITWTFHSERVTVQEAINFKSFLITIAGQVLYSNPVQLFIYSICLAAYAKGNFIADSRAVGLLMWCSVPIILATTLVFSVQNYSPTLERPGFSRFDDHHRDLYRFLAE